jgi:hypothetical protein
MSAEHTGGAELTKLMPNHILCDLYTEEGFSVMHHERLSDKLRYYGARPAPGFDSLTPTGVLGFHNLLIEFFVDVWAFFSASGHLLLLMERGYNVSCP